MKTGETARTRATAGVARFPPGNPGPRTANPLPHYVTRGMGRTAAFLHPKRSCLSWRKSRRGSTASCTCSQGQSQRPRLRPSTGYDFESTLSNHGQMQREAIISQVRPMTTSPELTELEPFTSAERAAALSMKWIQSDPCKMFGHVSNTTRGPTASMS